MRPATSPTRRPSIWLLAWRQTQRDFRAGELRLLLAAVMLAVAALTAVGFFADRIERGLARDARQMLGGDAIVSSDKPAPQAFVEEARRRALSVATTTTFPSMGRATEAQGGASRLVAVKAVSEAYPLRGRMKLQAGPGAQVLDAAGAPERGAVWVDAALLDALKLKMGDVLLLGDAALKITRLIVVEPDRGAGFMSFAPRVMVNHVDLATSGLVQPASRVTYRLAVASPIGRDADVAAYVRWAEAQVEQGPLRGVRIESMETGRPEMKQTLARAEKFLNLVALLAALLAAVAVAIASRDFANGHLDDCAMQRVLGQPQRSIALAYGIEFGLVGALASAVGVLLGLAVHTVFVGLLAGLVNVELPAPGAWPALFGIGVGLTLLAGFGLPPVLQLARVPPLRVIRRDVGAAQGLVAGRARRRCAGLRRAAAGGVGRHDAGADRGRRLRGGGGAVRFAVVAGGVVAQARGARNAGPALAGAGHAPDRRAAGVRRAAGLGTGGRPAGAGAAGAAAHRPDRQLARGHAARCAEPFRHQHPARAGRGLPAHAGHGGCGALRLVSR